MEAKSDLYRYSADIRSASRRISAEQGLGAAREIANLFLGEIQQSIGDPLHK
jgi:hypothetical protein